jgi:Protein of unknown function (DUF1222).
MGVAALLIAGIAPALMLVLLWADYLSLSVVGREFLSYQWDALLLEAGFLAVFVAPLVLRDRLSSATEPPRVARWMMLWLLFRLMVGSGAVKLASGDPMWHDLTALSVHFETQPLPTPLAWYAHQLPLAITKAMTAIVLIVELFAPLLILGGRRTRQGACVLLAGLQIAIGLTGNYAFFNLLTIALCIWLLDDRMLARWTRTNIRRPPAGTDIGVRPILATIAAMVIVPVSLLAFCGSIGFAMPGTALVAPIADAIAPLRSVDAYGLFAVMTPTRPEIIVEGSE